MTNSNLDPLLSLAHAIFSGKGTHALLLGSGISRSSRIPTGWDLTLDLIRRVAALEGEDPGADAERCYVTTHGAAPDYSRLLGALAPTSAERRALLQAYFEPTEQEREDGAKLPSPAHHAIARLVAKGYIRVLLTTNFDRLMETALRDEGIEPTVISTADAAEGAAPLVHQRCVIVKLHGDYLDDRVKNTDEELATYDPRMDAYLDRVLDEFGLVISGWSGEWDQALRSAFERCRSRRYTTWWAAVGSPGPRAMQLITLRQAQTVAITGADGFFTAVEEKVASLEALQAAPLLSAPTAVATLKRYIAEDRHRVRLDDLIRDEVVRLARRLVAEFPFQGGPSPTGELYAERVHRMDAAAEVARHLFFHGCRLALSGQQEVFTRALPLLVSNESVAGFELWSNLAVYPMSSILYAGSLGALANGNWGLLRELIMLRYRQRGIERIACSDLHAVYSMAEAAKYLHQKPHLTPESDHYAGVLVPLATGIVPDPDLLFDELEVLFTLAYLDAVSDLSSPPIWAPPGRFRWRGRMMSDDSQPGILFAEAEASGAEWAPLQVGWFGGSLARFQKVKQAFSSIFTRQASAIR